MCSSLLNSYTSLDLADIFLTSAAVLPTLQGTVLTVRKNILGRLVVTDGTRSANITTLDLLATNGVIHIIDAVLVPATPAPSECCLRLLHQGPAVEHSHCHALLEARVCTFLTVLCFRVQQRQLQ